MKLPIDDHLPAIAAEILSRQNVLIQSSPGSGKTTRIPSYLKKTFGNILVIEPRRIAAIYAASRIAEENKWAVGKEVGYEVRFDVQRSNDTGILFLTEALLAKKILSRPQLESIDLVIFDEFHERSIWTDLAIGHIKELQILGSPIKMIFLSATLDQAPLTNFFDEMGVINIELPRFPIDVLYQKKPFRYSWNNDFEINFLTALQEIIQRGKKQILVFLPGLKEIRNAERLLDNSGKFKKFQIQVLHGSIPLANQKSIVTNDSSFEFRILLSTNIAESSLTISGITAVLDSGLHREATYNSEYAETQLQTRKISLFSSIQRQGRANRLGPGVVYKMWSELDERSMEKAPLSDIKKSSLFEFGLHLVSMGHWPMNQFTWFEAPATHVLEELERTYLDYGLVYDRKLTDLGKLILDLNISYENALLLLLSDSFFKLDKAALIIAILESDYSAPDSMHTTQSTLLETLDYLNRNRNVPQEISKRALQITNGFNVSKIVKNGKSDLPRILSESDHKLFIEQLISKGKSDLNLDLILAFSYRDRLCKRRRQDATLSHRAITIKGKEVSLGDERKANQLPPLDYFINFKTIIDAHQTARCFSYHFIAPSVFDSAIRPFCKKMTRIEFVDSKQQFYKVVDLTYKKLVLDTLTHDPLDPKELKEKTKEIFIAEKESLLFSLPSFEEFLTRINWIKQSSLSSLQIEWEHLIEQEISLGLTLKNRNDWNFDLDSHLSYDEQKLLKTLTPKEISIKGLSRVFKVNYPKNESPYIESRLQHFLGLNTHPTILNTNLKLKVVLLGPHGRPIQITNDLPGFWKSSYPEIRKEMKGRYPKHAWPEDPTTFSN